MIELFLGLFGGLAGFLGLGVLDRLLGRGELRVIMDFLLGGLELLPFSLGEVLKLLPGFFPVVLCKGHGGR